MIYTFQRRRELNSEFMGRYFSLKSYEEKSGIPYLYVSELPTGAMQADSIRDLNVPQCSRPWNHVVPVFIRTLIVNGENGESSELYIVSYVNCSNPSLTMAADYIASGRLYYIPGVSITEKLKN